MSTKLKEAIEILKSIYNEHEEVSQRKFELEEKINEIENILSGAGVLNKNNRSSPVSRADVMDDKFKGKGGKVVYKEIIKSHFEYRLFKEHKLRGKATEEGFRVKGKPIKEITSRSVIRDLRKEGFLEAPERGSYRQVKQEEQKPLSRLITEQDDTITTHYDD